MCLVAQSCLTLCNPVDYSLPGPLSVGIFQARTLEWVAYRSSRRSSQPRDQTQVSYIAGRFFIVWDTREAQEYWNGWPIHSPRDLPDPEMKIKSCIADRFFTSWATREAQRRLLCPQGFSRQDTGVGYHALRRGIFPIQGSTQVSCIADGFFTIWAIREIQEYWSGYFCSPGELPNLGIKMGSPALKVDSLPAELPGKPKHSISLL